MIGIFQIDIVIIIIFPPIIFQLNTCTQKHARLEEDKLDWWHRHMSAYFKITKQMHLPVPHTFVYLICVKLALMLLWFVISELAGGKMEDREGEKGKKFRMRTMHITCIKVLLYFLNYTSWYSFTPLSALSAALSV